MFHLGHFSFNRIIGRKTKRDVNVHKNIMSKKKGQSGRKKLTILSLRVVWGRKKLSSTLKVLSVGLIIKYT